MSGGWCSSIYGSLTCARITEPFGRTDQHQLCLPHRCGRKNKADRCRRVSTGLRAMLFRSTYARHRIRHGIRHTAARAGRGLCPCVANGRLRHILIGSARVSKADGSQSLNLQRDALRAEGAAFLFQAQGRAETFTTGHR